MIDISVSGSLGVLGRICRTWWFRSGCGMPRHIGIGESYHRIWIYKVTVDRVPLRYHNVLCTFKESAERNGREHLRVQSKKGLPYLSLPRRLRYSTVPVRVVRRL